MRERERDGSLVVAVLIFVVLVVVVLIFVVLVVVVLIFVVLVVVLIFVVSERTRKQKEERLINADG